MCLSTDRFQKDLTHKSKCMPIHHMIIMYKYIDL